MIAGLLTGDSSRLTDVHDGCSLIRCWTRLVQFSVKLTPKSVTMTGTSGSPIVRVDDGAVLCTP